MKISKTQAYAGITVLTDAAQKFFLRDGARREIEQQRAVFDGRRSITNVLSDTQEKARAEGKAFEADWERAEDRARDRLTDGISLRLKGAFACYEADLQLECLRHILIALDVICVTLGWEKASTYLNEQNRILIELVKEDEKV